MFKLNKFAGLVLTAVLGAVALITPPATHAKEDYGSSWQTQYPTSQSFSNAACMLCHTTTTGKSGLNPYGTDLNNVLPASPSNTELSNALIAIEGNDSDHDPTVSSNLVEINASTQPGWAVGDNPSGVSGDLDPITPVADISVIPLSVNFGAVTVATSATDSVAISNDGSAELTVDSLTLSGASEFILSSSPATPFMVAASTSVDLIVEYAPLNDGLDSGTLEIASNSPGEELISVALSGTGVPVQVNECVPVVDPASLQFGSVELGNTLALTTAVTNNGTLECAVEAAVSSTSGEFSLASGVMFTIAPGASVNVDVNYTPADPGDDAGQLALTFPDRSINVPLSGTGIESGGGDSGSSSLSLFDLGLLVLFGLLGLARRKLP